MEDLQREPAPQDDKGVLEYETTEEGMLHVLSEDEKLLEEMGVLSEFLPEKLAIMKARALAYGYELEAKNG